MSNSVSLGSSNQLSIGMLLGVRACVSVRVRVGCRVSVRVRVSTGSGRRAVRVASGLAARVRASSLPGC